MGGGGAGRGGIPASFPSRFAKNLQRLGGFWGKGPRPLVGRAPSPGGPGPKPPGDLAHRPLGPGSRGLTSCGVLDGLCQALGGPGPKPPGDLAHRPLGPGSRHSHPVPATITPRFGAVREKRRRFSPSPPSATIQHAPQGRRIKREP